MDDQITEVEVMGGGGATDPGQGARDDSSLTSNHSRYIDDHDPDAMLARFKNSVRIARRHSTQLAPGVVYPIPEGTGEGVGNIPGRPKKPLRRSSTLRGLANPSKAWAPMLAGLGRAGASLKTYNGGSEDNKEDVTVVETPYEEMMVRFQIRQLQRTPSGTTGRSEDKRGSVGSSRSPDSENPGGSTGHDNGFTELITQPGIEATLEHQLLTQLRLTSLRASDQVSVSQDGELNGPDASHGNSRLGSVDANAEDFPHQINNADDFRATYVAFFPLGFAFPEEKQFAYVDGAVGILLAIDVILTLHTSYMTADGLIVDSHREIARNYLKTRFVLDILLAVPLIIQVNSSTSDVFRGAWMHFILDIISAERLAYVARFVRMIWLIRLNQSGSGNSFWAWLMYSRYSHLLRIASIVIMLIAIAHYIACVWNVLLQEGGDLDDEHGSWQAQYSASFYAALLLLQGEGVPTDTAAQNLFASLSVLVGSIVLAVIFGHVAILVSNFNANFTSYQRKMEAVFAMTAKLPLPPSLRERIHEYYEHLWHEYECLDGEIVQFSKELSHTLGLEVVLFKYMELVMHVPFWKDCTPDFQKQLMLRLDVRVYLPNDFIMREGEVDDEFYMVNRGYCELSRALHRFERISNTMIGMRRTSTPGLNTGRSQGGLTARGSLTGRRGSATSRRRYSGLSAVNLNDGHRQSAYELDPAQLRYYSSTGRRTARVYEIMVTRGQAFGDLALLMNYQRAANVRAITHVEMCVLSRENFQAVLTRYPEDRRRVVVDMLMSYMQSYEMVHSRCPLLELVRKVYSAEAVAEACARLGSPPPLLPPVLTARQAAERIYTAINLETNDATLKFGIGVNIRAQLIDLRERMRQKRQGKQHPRSILHRSVPNLVQKTGGDGSDRRTSEHTSDTNEVESIPTPSNPPEPTQVQAQAQAKPVLSWQERLKQAEGREVVILQALQDLQASFKLLQARQASSTVHVAPACETAVLPPLVVPTSTSELEAARAPPNRKRSLLETEIPQSDAAAITRPRLLKRMGSFVGRSSTNTPDTRVQQQEVKPSPTRFADQLFQAHTKAASFRVPMSQRLQRGRGLPKLARASTFSMASERSPRRDTTDNSTATLFSPAEPNAANVEPPRRRTIQRTHSQVLQVLVEGKPALHGHLSIGSAPNTNAPGRLFRRLSPAQTETRESPTRYADALFRPRQVEMDNLSTDTDTLVSTDQ
ncbi:hypothetical protein PF010_g11869 [Phytophthora fragariae]|uniref:Cyclic nucleotide-binding domain-containing protein n=1 Tax=Phytophthora fragariae TaxID=53985 RepID=A0A6G0L5B4_9STRA|nr:hypothetical protein PF010_g11869 [Phytophthora fragariae]